MITNERPLNRSITIGCLIFIAALCIVISIVNYVAFYRGLYERNNIYLTDIIRYVDQHIDKDDLAECARTGEESETYHQLQTFLDSVVDTFSNISYLYIITPLNTTDYDNASIIINGITKEEYEGEYDELYFLGDIPHDSFPARTMVAFFEAMNHIDEVTFDQDTEPTEWGLDYTGMLPLQDSKGETFALLCVDISVASIHAALFTHNIVNILLVVCTGTLFSLSFILWSRTHITNPIAALEESVTAFAETSHGQVNPEKLIYNEPDIHTKNEVESLSNAVTQMTGDLKDYAIGIVAAEKQITSLQRDVAQLDTLAYQDALTRVKNKTAYDKAIALLNIKISDGTAAFGIVMIDLNNLKLINDTYGHERGNDYLTGACNIICEVYEHSPVFRIGGDEFAVLLEGRDYRDRNLLIDRLNGQFVKAMHDEGREPWKRYSAAAGMSEYAQATDADAESVFKRADKSMYQNKVAMKKNEC